MFQGEDAADTLAHVLTKEPNFDRAPQKVRRLLQRCLEKDPKRRLRDIGVVSELLDSEPSATSRPSWMWPSAAGILLIALIGAGYALFPRPAQNGSVLRTSIVPPPGTRIDMPELSPDGRRIVFVAQEGTGAGMWIRELDTGASRRIPGSEGSSYP